MGGSNPRAALWKGGALCEKDKDMLQIFWAPKKLLTWDIFKMKYACKRNCYTTQSAVLAVLKWALELRCEEVASLDVSHSWTWHCFCGLAPIMCIPDLIFVVLPPASACFSLSTFLHYDWLSCFLLVHVCITDLTPALVAVYILSDKKCACPVFTKSNLA